MLADEHGSLFFAAGAFGTPAAPDFVDDLADAFRTGLGLPYDRQGPAGAHRTERMLGPWTRLALVPRILPALRETAFVMPGPFNRIFGEIHDKLEQGVRQDPKWRYVPSRQVFSPRDAISL